MRYFRIFFGVGLTALFAFAGYLTLLSHGWLGGGSVVKVKDVPVGQQEIAFLLPASGGDTWERFVAAVDALKREWPELGREPGRLHVDKKNAFVRLTTDVPEVLLWFDGHEDSKICVRWYKLSSEATPKLWIDELVERERPPLAVVGGDNSYNALRLAEELERQRRSWHGQPPLFLITTATAERPAPEEQSNLALDFDVAEQGYKSLIEVYRGRTFRYAFTNSHMAESVLDFVDANADLRPALPRGNRAAATLAGGVGAGGTPWGGLGLKLVLDRLRQPILHTVSWEDDRYSVDLALRFTRRFVQRYRRSPGSEQAPDIITYPITYSTGDQFQPNPRELRTIEEFKEENNKHREQRQIVVLPTSAQRAQRWLRAAVGSLALSSKRNLVVVSGDSITFNNIYRDRQITWNPADLPVSLVLFSHRNPIDTSVGFKPQEYGEPEASCTGTDDLLLYRDILESVLLAAFRKGRLLDDTDAVLAGLRQVAWAKERVGPADAGESLFGASGERRPHTGERVIWLRPGERRDAWKAGVNVLRRAGDEWVQEEEELKVK